MRTPLGGFVSIPVISSMQREKQTGTRRLPLPLFLLILIAWLNGCSGWAPARPVYPPGYPVGFVERGSASWYGPGFHGNRTANGEVYDMHKLTAAHRTLPGIPMANTKFNSQGELITKRILDIRVRYKEQIAVLREVLGPEAKSYRIDITIEVYP